MSAVGRGLGYRPALDGVRAIAIALVVALHAFGWPAKGALGVDLFFVLSGFLITTILIGEQRQNGAIALGAFYMRRALRLLPALFVLLAVYAAVQLAHHRSPWLPLAFAVGYVANIAEASGSHAMQPQLGHLWSLAQEEQFYLLWAPALLLLRCRKPAVLRLLAFLILAVILERVALMAQGVRLDPRIYRAPDTHADPLLVGCVAGVVFVQGWPAWLERRRGQLALVALALILATAIFGGRLKLLFYVLPGLTLFACGCALLILGVATGGGVVARLLSTRGSVFVGRLSYSLYLWHVPILVWLGGGFAASDETLGHKSPLLGIAAVALAVGAAAASHYFVERPFLRLKSRRRDQAEQATASHEQAMDLGPVAA